MMGLNRPHWRKTTWFIVIFNVLMLIWLISAIGATDTTNCASLADELERNACEAGTAIGAGVAAGIVVFLWVAGDFILGVLLLVTNRKKMRECPSCGTDVKKGLTRCGKCGYDFAAAASR